MDHLVLFSANGLQETYDSYEHTSAFLGLIVFSIFKLHLDDLRIEAVFISIEAPTPFFL